MKRDPSRPKAEDIPDVDMLIACRDRAIGPLSKLYPYKVVQAKIDKLVKRGLLTNHAFRPTLTEAGRLFLKAAEMEGRASSDEAPAFVPSEEYDPQDRDTQLEIEGGSMRKPEPKRDMWRRS